MKNHITSGRTLRNLATGLLVGGLMACAAGDGTITTKAPAPHVDPASGARTAAGTGGEGTVAVIGGGGADGGTGGVHG